MQLLKWSTEFEIGSEVIDNQHKQLVNMINELNLSIEYCKPNSEIAPLVARLLKYADTHFKEEEELFTKYGFADRKEHEADHAKFIDSLNYVQKQCEIIDDPVSYRLRVFLLTWLFSHIKSKDMEYKHLIDSVAR